MAMGNLPAFRDACLGSGRSNVVSLVGSNNPGELEVYSIDLGDLNAATSNFKAKDVTGTSWDPSLPKYCFSPPSGGGSAGFYLGVTAIQFRNNSATMGSLHSTGVSDSVGLQNGSPKLFTLSVASGEEEMFSAYVRDEITGSMMWKGFYVNFNDAIKTKLLR